MKNKKALSYGYYDRTQACHEDGGDQPMHGWDGDGYYVLVEYDGAIERVQVLVGCNTEEEVEVLYRKLG